MATSKGPRQDADTIKGLNRIAEFRSLQPAIEAIIKGEFFANNLFVDTRDLLEIGIEELLYRINSLAAVMLKEEIWGRVADNLRKSPTRLNDISYTLDSRRSRAEREYQAMGLEHYHTHALNNKLARHEDMAPELCTDKIDKPFENVPELDDPLETIRANLLDTVDCTLKQWQEERLQARNWRTMAHVSSMGAHVDTSRFGPPLSPLDIAFFNYYVLAPKLVRRSEGGEKTELMNINPQENLRRGFGTAIAIMTQVLRILPELHAAYLKANDLEARELTPEELSKLGRETDIMGLLRDLARSQIDVFVAIHEDVTENGERERMIADKLELVEERGKLKLKVKKSTIAAVRDIVGKRITDTRVVQQRAVTNRTDRPLVEGMDIPKPQMTYCPVMYAVTTEDGPIMDSLWGIILDAWEINCLKTKEPMAA